VYVPVITFVNFPPFVNVRQGSEARAFSQERIGLRRIRNKADATAESADKDDAKPPSARALLCPPLKVVGGLLVSSTCPLEVQKGSGAEGMVVTGDLLVAGTCAMVVEVSVATGTNLRFGQRWSSGRILSWTD